MSEQMEQEILRKFGNCVFTRWYNGNQPYGNQHQVIEDPVWVETVEDYIEEAWLR